MRNARPSVVSAILLCLRPRVASRLYCCGVYRCVVYIHVVVVCRRSCNVSTTSGMTFALIIIVIVFIICRATLLNVVVMWLINRSSPVVMCPVCLMYYMLPVLKPLISECSSSFLNDILLTRSKFCGVSTGFCRINCYIENN